MNVDDGLKILQWQFGKCLVAQDSRIVDENVHPAPLIHDLGYHCFDFVDLRDIGPVCDGFAAFAANFFDDFLSRLRGTAGAIACTAKIIDSHLCPPFSKS